MNDHQAFVSMQKKFAAPNVETSTRCTLHCPLCVRNKLKDSKNSNNYKFIKERITSGNDISMDDAEKLLKFFDKGLMLCGSLSDPVYWTNFLEFLDLSKKYPHKEIGIHTAASQRNIEWYRDAFSRSGNNVIWKFGLDGMADTSMIYRIRQDSQLLFDAMLLAKDMGIRVEWHYIVFKHNEHQIDQAKAFANKHKINLFFTKSDRSGAGMEVPVNWQPNRNKEILKYEN